MKTDPLSAEAFQRKFSASIRRAVHAAQLCVDRPTSDAVHEARISIRKVMAAVSLMPRGYRNSNRTRVAVKRLRLFYRACAGMRDIDTVERALRGFTAYGSVESITQLLAERRAVLLHNVVRSGDKVKDLKMPRFEGVTERRFRKRLSKLLKVRAERAARFYTSAAGNENRVRELHRLRKECRGIMYLLGFAEQGSAIKTAEAALEDARRKLGSIRDEDLLLEVLRGVRQDTAAKLAEAVSASRHKKYGQFFDSRPANAVGPGLLKIIRSSSRCLGV